MNNARPFIYGQQQQQRMVKIRFRGRSYPIAEAVALAGQLHGSGNMEEAANLYRILSSQMPNSPEIHNNLGAILQRLSRNDEALRSYDKALALKPDYANAHYNRGSLLKKLGRTGEALKAYDRAIELNPGHADAYNSRGILFQDGKRHAEAVASYSKAVELDPRHAIAFNNLGTAMMNKGTMAEAEKMFETACQLRPDFVDPLFNLTQIRKYKDTTHADAQRIRALLSKADLLPEHREHLLFGLGKILDDCRRYDEAFECFAEANRIRNVQAGYNAEKNETSTGEIIHVFNADLLGTRKAFVSESAVPVFVLGMPRSGTTLIAAMLSNHPAIATAGELPAFMNLASGLTENRLPYPQSASHLTESNAVRIISEYERQLKCGVSPGARYIIDKNPLNFRHVGLIAMLFPHARIIHCTRQPMAVGLSNFFQRFPLALDYAFDLQNIGHFLSQYDRLMQHWRQMPVRMMEIGYEDAIANTEAVARRMLEFLELDWDDRCIAPHTNPHSVETASHWQVRQPIYRDSIERWRHYEKFLSPLKQALSGLC